MKIAFFSAKNYEKKIFDSFNRKVNHKIVYLEPHLNEDTVTLAIGFNAVCVFVNDNLNANVVEALAGFGIKLIALRCAGYNNVDLETASRYGIKVVRVPAYSPYSVAEHTVALILALNRKIYKAYHRVREGNFALDGLLGYDLNGRTVGIIGTGKIGEVVAKIMKGFGCNILAFDHVQNKSCLEMGVKYISMESLFAESDLITLHCPLTKETHHLINSESLDKMKKGVVLINTSRGALIDTKAVIKALKSGKVGALGLDVYEEEGDLFFEDQSGNVIQDDIFARLLTFPNVVITGHQAFFTKEALDNIAETTVENLNEFEKSGASSNEISLAMIKK